METIINLLPEPYRPWAATLSADEIAAILLTHRMDSMYKHVESKQVQPPIATSSAQIGQIGEAEVEAILNKNYDTVNTAKTGKCGDFIIMVNGRKIIIEVKRYKKTVPGLEISKFQRDIQAHSSIQGAIMISLTSKIVGMSKSLEHTHVRNNGANIPVIYLSLAGLDTVEDIITAAVNIVVIDAACQARHVSMEADIDQAISDMCCNIDYLSNCRMTIDEAQVSMNKYFRKLMQNVLFAEINLKRCIDRIQSKIDISQQDTKEYNEADIKELMVSKNIDEKLGNLIHACIKALGDAGNSYQIVKPNIIKLGSTSIKINKTNAAVITLIPPSAMAQCPIPLHTIDGKWSYTGGKLTVELTEQTLQSIIAIIT
jgi:hypothetical protein